MVIALDAVNALGRGRNAAGPGEEQAVLWRRRPRAALRRTRTISFCTRMARCRAGRRRLPVSRVKALGDDARRIRRHARRWAKTLNASR